MAVLKFIFEVQGGSPVQLPTSPIDPLPLVLTGTTPGTVRFSVSNPLARDVSLSGASVALSGPAAAKATAAVDTQFPLLIPAGTSAEVSVTVTPTEPIFEGETLSVQVTAQE